MSTIEATADPDRRIDRRRGGGTDALAAAGFWGAIALPAVYLPALIAAPVLAAGTPALLGLFGLHLVALYLGRNHRTGDAGGRTS